MNLLDILNIDLKSLVKFINILVIRFIYNSLINYGFHEIIKFYRIANDTIPFRLRFTAKVMINILY